MEDVETSIPARLERIVLSYPERWAVKMGKQALTYDQLNLYANRIAHAIIGKRHHGNEPIALLFDYGIDAIAAILGVLKAAKCYVFLDPKFPPERMRYILEDCRASLLVTNSQQWPDALKLHSGQISFLNTDHLDSSLPYHNLRLKILADELESLSYTSGSEGHPKGVKQTHRVSLSSYEVISQRRPARPDDRLSLVHSLSFESAKLHLHQALLSGAALFPFDVQRDGVVQMAKWLEEEQITIVHMPPALFRQLAECLPAPEKLRSLRLIYLSGAPITKLDFEL